MRSFNNAYNDCVGGVIWRNNNGNLVWAFRANVNEGSWCTILLLPDPDVSSESVIGIIWGLTPNADTKQQKEE